MKPNTLSLIFFTVLTCFATMLGVEALVPPPDGCYPNFTTAEGCDALNFLTTGAANTGIGWRSLFFNTTGNFNTGIGVGSLALNNASSNTAVGAAALLLNSTGGLNVGVGTDAMVFNDTGIGNTAVGYQALMSNTTGNGNIALGLAAGVSVTTATNVTCIGATGANVSGTCFIGRIRGVTTQHADAMPVLIDSANQLGTASSSRRYKTDIKPIDNNSACVLGLKPVSFRYKAHTDTTPQFGLIAEDVAEVNPDLVIYGSDGKPYTVRYDAVNAMLLNEFLKEHRTVQEQKAIVAQLKQDSAEQRKQIEALTAGLQKMSAQLELNKSTPQTAQNTD